jgi:hypothetical protein
VWPAGLDDARGSLWFRVGGRVVEAGPRCASAAPPLVLDVDDPAQVAERCWDTGFTVHLHRDETGPAPVSAVDPFGRRVGLAPRPAAVCPGARQR